MLQDTSTLSIEPLSDYEKQVYNCFLATGKKAKNQPFKYRQNFANFDPSKHLAVKKLSLFFYKFDHIKMTDFFVAPYVVYGGDDYYDLAFYNSRRAIACYSQYMKKQQTDDADGDNNLATCKEAMKFIFKFCAQHKITLDEYKSYKAEGTVPIVLTHLKEHRINFYTLHALEMDAVLNSFDSDFLNFYVDDFFSIYRTTRTKFFASTTLKHLMRKGFEIFKSRC